MGPLGTSVSFLFSREERAIKSFSRRGVYLSLNARVICFFLTEQIDFLSTYSHSCVFTIIIIRSVPGFSLVTCEAQTGFFDIYSFLLCEPKLNNWYQSISYFDACAGF